MLKNILTVLLVTISSLFCVNAQSPQLRGSDCNRVNTQLTQYLYANMVGAVQYRFRVTNVNLSVTDSITVTPRRFRLNDIPTISRYGSSYEVEVSMDNGSGFGAYGNICTPSSAAIVTQLRSSDCGKNLPTIGTTVYASQSTADSWDFEVRNTTDPGTTELISGLTSRAFNLTMASAQFQLYSQEYEIRVRTTQGGVVQPFGNWCSVFTPSVITKLRSVDCGRILTSIDYPVYATVTSADSWDFEVRNVTDPGTTEIINRPNREFRLTYATSPFQLYNQEYEIRVRTIQGGIVQPWGDWCSVFTPNIAPPDITSGCGNTFEYLAYEYITCTDIGAEQYEFLLRIGSTFVDTVYTAINQVRIADFLDASNQPNYDYNTTYNIVARGLFGGVWTAYGTGCSITTTSFPHAEVQHLCSAQLNSFNTPISVYAVFNATDYEFEVTDLSSTFNDGIQTINKPTRSFKLNELTNYTYGHEYSIRCRVTFKGTQYPYSTACSLTAPQPETKLRNSDCPRILTTMNKTLYANPLTADNPSGVGLTEYNFRIGSDESGWQSSRAITLADIITPAFGQVYTVEVRARYNGVDEDYGSGCNITTPASLIIFDEEYAPESKRNSGIDIVNVFPNPTNDQFVIEPTKDFLNKKVNLTLYDLNGKEVKSQENMTMSAGVDSIELGRELQKGVYFLHVTTEDGFSDAIQLKKL